MLFELHSLLEVPCRKKRHDLQFYPDKGNIRSRSSRTPMEITLPITKEAKPSA